MLDLSKIFGKKKTSSKDLAKERLQLVLVHDRANVSPEFLETIKDEIMQVLEKYMDIADDKGLDIHITTAKSEDGNSQVPALVASIPIGKVKNR